MLCHPERDFVRMALDDLDESGGDKRQCLLCRTSAPFVCKLVRTGADEQDAENLLLEIWPVMVADAARTRCLRIGTTRYFRDALIDFLVECWVQPRTPILIVPTTRPGFLVFTFDDVEQRVRDAAFGAIGGLDAVDY